MFEKDSTTEYQRGFEDGKREAGETIEKLSKAFVSAVGAMLRPKSPGPTLLPDPVTTPMTTEGGHSGQKTAQAGVMDSL